MELFSSKEGLCFQQLITYPEIKINADCFSFITGKSGCGKSTYLRMLSATLSAPDGQIFYRSKPPEDPFLLPKAPVRPLRPDPP